LPQRRMPGARASVNAATCVYRWYESHAALNDAMQARLPANIRSRIQGCRDLGESTHPRRSTTSSTIGTYSQVRLEALYKACAEREQAAVTQGHATPNDDANALHSTPLKLCPFQRIRALRIALSTTFRYAPSRSPILKPRRKAPPGSLSNLRYGVVKETEATTAVTLCFW
jgi:hypothetical protein